MQTKYNKQQIVDTLYKEGINTTNRIETRPDSNEKILTPPQLSVINIGGDLIKKDIYIRASFVGSQTFYTYHINRNELMVWADIILELTSKDEIPKANQFLVNNSEEIQRW